MALKESKHEKFAQLIFSGLSKSEAYRQSHPSCLKWQAASVHNKAYATAKRKDVRGRINELAEESKLVEAGMGSVNIDKQLHRDLIELGIEDLSDFVSDAIIQKLENSELVIRRRRAINHSTRYAVFERSGFKCQCCGASPRKDNNITLHVDHIIPYSLGGGCDKSNLQSLCSECNLSKGNRHHHDHNEGWVC